MGTVPQFLTHICCGQMAGWIKMPLDMEVGLGRGDFVLDGVQLPLPKRGRSPLPNVAAHVHCGQTTGWIKMTLGMEVGLGPGHIVLDGDVTQLPSTKWGQSFLPNFRPVFIVAKRLDASRCHSVRLSPGDFMLDGDPAPSSKRGRSPQFSAHVYCD